MTHLANKMLQKKFGTARTTPAGAQGGPPRGLRNSAAVLANQMLTDRFGAQAAQQGSELEFQPFGELREEDIGTSLDLRPRQEAYEAGTRRSTQRMEMGFHAQGPEVWEEYQRRLEEDGAVGALERLDNAAETALSGVLETISATNYAAAGAATEFAKSGNLWEAFKQGATEFADAMPYFEVEGAEKLTYEDFFTEIGVSKWSAAGLGLASDVFLDPINLVPGGFIAKGLGMTGRLAKPVAKAAKADELFHFLFTPHRQAHKFGPAGDRAIELLGWAESNVDNELAKKLDKVDELTAWMLPHERTFFGLYLSKPEKLAEQLDVLVREKVPLPDGKVMTAERRDELVGQADKIREYYFSLLDEEAKAGIIDPLLKRFDYNYGSAALDPRIARSEVGKVMRDRGAPNAYVSPLVQRGKVFPSARPKTYSDNAQRLEDTLSGKLRDKATGEPLTTEFDIKNLMTARSYENVRWLETRKLFRNAIGDGHINARVVPKKKGVMKDYTKWQAYKKELEDANPGFRVVEFTRTTQKGPSQKTIARAQKTGKKARAKSKPHTEVTEAYMMPTPVADVLTGADQLAKSNPDLEKFFRGAHKLLTPWKGWATATPGFHTRNYTSILFMNYMAGVGAKGVYGKAPPSIKDFSLRHLQALKVQTLAQGAGRMPAKAKKYADKISKGLGMGFKSLDDVPLPKITIDGKTLSAEDIIAAGEARAVPMNASRLHDMPDEAMSAVFRNSKQTVPVEILESTGLEETAKKALTIQARARRTIGESVSRAVGPHSPVMNMHLAFGQVVENNGRWALFLDRLAKGQGLDDAARAPKKWHFDYRNLTDTEKYVMRWAMPFYSWQRFALPRMVMAFAENPARMSHAPKLMRALEDISPDLQDTPTPDYFEEIQAFQIPFIRDDKPVFAAPDLPVRELNRLNVDDVLSSMNPLPKALFESYTGENIFTGAPLEQYPGEASDLYPWLSKEAQHHLESLVPPVGAYWMRPKKYAERGQSAEYWLSQFTGVKFRSLDARRVLRAKTFQRNKIARQYKKKLDDEARKQAQR